MAFLGEELSDEDKNFYVSLKLPYPLSTSMMADIPWDWITDRERDIFFLCVGGQGYQNSEEYPPYYYYLIWKKQLIRIEAYYNKIGNSKEARKYIFKINRILVPLALKTQSSLLVEIIKEAITEERRSNDRYFGTIEFTDISTPFFMEGDVRYE